MTTWYFIYLKREGLTPTLYAVTDKKKLKDSFLRERNPKLFFCKKKSLNKYEDLNVKEILRRRMLHKSFLITKDDIGKHEVKIVLTEDEELECYTGDSIALKEISKHVDYQMMYANDDLLKSLNTLLYFHILNTYENRDNPFLDCNPTPIFDVNYSVDTLGLFIKLYGYTLKKE